MKHIAFIHYPHIFSNIFKFGKVFLSWQTVLVHQLPPFLGKRRSSGKNGGGKANKKYAETSDSEDERQRRRKKEKERKATSKKGGGGGRNSHSDENSDIDEAIAAYYAVRIDKNQVENILSNKTMIRRIMLFG